jgi:hypothetical protein
MDSLARLFQFGLWPEDELRELQQLCRDYVPRLVRWAHDVLAEMNQFGRALSLAVMLADPRLNLTSLIALSDQQQLLRLFAKTHVRQLDQASTRA